MPITIGAKPGSGFRDPMGLLADCHRRIESFLSVLIRVASEAKGGILRAEQRSALETALRYFREAAPKHTHDEEESLFPRLRSLDRPEVNVSLAKVDTLEREHVEMERLHAEVDRIGQAWLAAGTLPSTDAQRLSELLSILDRSYRGHIEIEERDIFPVAAAALAEADRMEIGNEMAKRRGLPGI